MTGWIGLVDRGRIAPGDWLAVLGGAGGSGAAAVQLGHALGARVIAVVSDEERAAFCRSLGAEATINYRDGSIAPALRELTGGRGVDLIYDPVGGSLAEEAAGALARNGRLLAVGFASGEWPSLATIQLVMTNSSLVGVFAGGYAGPSSRRSTSTWPTWSPTGSSEPRSLRRSPSTIWLLPHSPWLTAVWSGNSYWSDDAMTKAPDFDLDADEIVTAAVEIFEESGLDAVSMRSVSARLGVSPVPLYSRIGNKEALVDAIADRLLVDLAPPSVTDESWEGYAVRWTRSSGALGRARDSRLILLQDATHTSRRRVHSSRPCGRDGMSADAAVQACRILMWATVGFGAVESGVEPPRRARRRSRPGGDPGGVDAAEADTLFDIHIRYIVEGITRDADSEPASRRRGPV